MTAKAQDNGKPDTLAAALLKLQEHPIVAKQSKENPHFRSKYADLEDCWNAIREPLQEAGLCVRQTVNPEACITYLHHPATGEADDPVIIPILNGSDMQKLGSAITYARRYGLVVACNILTGEDDDGNAASASPRATVTARKSGDTEKTATAKQRGLLNGKAGEKGLPALVFLNILRDAHGRDPIEDMSEEVAAEAVNRILDRLPARLVDPVLEGIESAEVPA